MIYHSSEQVSTAPESTDGLTPLHLQLGIAYSNLRPVCSPVRSSWADVASRGSLELCSEWSDATEDFYMLHASTLGRPTLRVCGLLFQSRAVVAPRRYPSTIIALTVDWGRSSMALGQSSSVCLILLPVFVYGDSVVMWLNLYTR